MKKIFTKEVIIGTCVILAIAILIFGIEFLKGVNLFKPANFYIAQYDNVAGLETAAPVTIDGYKVGQVREINFDYENPGKIEVVMALNKNLHLPKDSKAIIGSTLLSGSYIEIKLGQSKELLEVGGILETGVSSDLMASLSNDVMPAVTEVIPKIDALLVSLNNLASDPALLKSVQNLEVITEHVGNASESLDHIMQNDVPGIMKGVSGTLTNVNGIVNTVDGVAENLNTITSDLTVLSAQLKTLPINSTMENVNAIVANLETFSNKLNDNKSSLGLLMNDPKLYNNLERVTADIDSLIIDIKKNPKRYISIKLL